MRYLVSSEHQHVHYKTEEHRRNWLTTASQATIPGTWLYHWTMLLLMKYINENTVQWHMHYPDSQCGWRIKWDLDLSLNGSALGQTNLGVTYQCMIARFCLVFGQYMVLRTELENLLSIMANWAQWITSTVSPVAASARQLEWWQENINTITQCLQELRDANKYYFDQAANFQGEDPQIGNLALLHETKIEQYHSANLNGR